MRTAKEILQTYIDSIRSPAAAAALFAEDGIIELPWVKAHAQGPAAVENLIAGILTKVPDFRFKAVRFWIEMPDRVFAEYDAEGLVVDTGKTYQQTYAGLLIAENGKIKLLREALNTVAAASAFSKD